MKNYEVVVDKVVREVYHVHADSRENAIKYHAYGDIKKRNVIDVNSAEAERFDLSELPALKDKEKWGSWV